MSSVRSSITVDAPIAVVYRYLFDRYDSPAHCETSLAIKGYVPAIFCVEAEEPSYLCFDVKGRDPVMRTFVGSWRWEYELRAVTEDTTDVTICYRWGWIMSLLGMGTIRAQACNEIVGAAMAIDALAWHHTSGRHAKIPRPTAQSSDAIREQRE